MSEESLEWLGAALYLRDRGWFEPVCRISPGLVVPVAKAIAGAQEVAGDE